MSIEDITDALRDEDSYFNRLFEAIVFLDERGFDTKKLQAEYDLILREHVEMSMENHYNDFYTW